MRRILLAVCVFALSAISALASDGMVRKQSPHDVPTTMDRLEAALTERGIKVVARIDHAKAAIGAELELRPTVLLVFGNPKLGTPLMQASPEMAIDLPMKVIAWEDDSGQTWIAYTDPAYLKARHGVEGKDKVFETMTGALGKITDAVVQP
jgi:uncharacterized protein (DUF302 family)